MVTPSFLEESYEGTGSEGGLEWGDVCSILPLPRYGGTMSSLLSEEN